MSLKALTKVQLSKKLWCLKRAQTGEQLAALRSQGKSAEIWWHCSSEEDAQDLTHLSHYDQRTQFRLLSLGISGSDSPLSAAKSYRLLHWVSTNSLILFHLLTTHLHHLSRQHCLEVLIYQTERSGSILGAE